MNGTDILCKNKTRTQTNIPYADAASSPAT